MKNTDAYKKTLTANIVPLAVKIVGFAMASALMVTAKGLIGPEGISLYEFVLATIAIMGSYMMVHYIPSYRSMMLVDAIVGIAFSVVMLTTLVLGDKELTGRAFYIMLIMLVPIGIFFGAQKSRTRDRLLSHSHKQFLDDYRTAVQITTTIAGLIGSTIAVITLNSGFTEDVIGGIGISLILIGDIMGIYIWSKLGRHVRTHKDDLWGKKEGSQKNSIRAVMKRLRKV